MAASVSEIYVRGRWKTVPSLEYDGRTLVVKGRLLRTAAVRSEEFLDRELDHPERALQLLRESRGQMRADVFTFGQKVPHSEPKYPYRFEWESTAVARVGNFKEWWDGLPQATRKNVRRAEKRGVVVVLRAFDDGLVSEIVALNDQTPFRQGVRNGQYGKPFDQVKKDHSSFLDRSDFICAYAGGELIGLLKVVYRGDVASVLNLLTRPADQDKRPANAMIAKAVQLCEAKSVSFLTYGLFNYGNKRDSPLREFKIRNGFGEMLVPRYFVPLTPWGALCVAVGAHRGLHGILPPWLISFLVRLRARWNALRSSGTSHEPV